VGEAEGLVIPFDGAVQAGTRSIVGHSRHSGMRLLAQARKSITPVFAFSIHRLAQGVWIPGSRYARPGMTIYVSTSPVLDPLAAESLRPCGRPK
jgi:hypothetical protein